MMEHTASLEEAARRLQVPPQQLVTKVDSLLSELEQVARRAETLERELLRRQVRELPRREVAGVGVVSGVLSISASDLLREAGDWLRNDLKSGVVILGAVVEDRPTMIIMATRDVVDQGVQRRQCGQGGGQSNGRRRRRQAGYGPGREAALPTS